MKLISNELEVSLQYQEEKRDNIISARLALEEALVFQFRQLSKGLFSFAFLKGLPTCSHKMFYLSQEDDVSVCSDEILKKYMEDFIKDAINNKFSVIQLKKLNDIDIRIYNKYVKLWDTMEINEQLAQLGSSLRLFFAGIEDLAVSRIGQIIGMESKGDIDARFILGNIGILSSTYFGEVFDFVDEKAISPFLDNHATGFTIEDISVVRQCLIKQTMNKSNDDKIFMDEWMHVFLHENGHAMSYSYRLNFPFGTFLWEKYMERDLLRYLQTPHTKSDIEKDFHIIDYISFNTEHIRNNLPYYDETREMLSKKFQSMEDILNSMIENGTIEIIKDTTFEKKYINNIHREGVTWNLS